LLAAGKPELREYKYVYVPDAAQKLQAQLESNFERLAKAERARYASGKAK
jgi:hypothetical protein